MAIRSTRPRPDRRRAREAGLTLVELLVSLVILGFVMALVSQAVFQVTQVTRAAEATTRGLAARWGAGWSVTSVFANLVAPPEVTGASFEGSPARVAGYTSVPLDGAGLGVRAFALQLRAGTGAESTTDLLSIGAEGVTPTVATFPGRAEFAFVDDRGRTLDQWPPLTRRETDTEDLPRTVLVRDAASGQVLMWYAFQGENVKPKPTARPFGGSTE